MNMNMNMNIYSNKFNSKTFTSKSEVRLIFKSDQSQWVHKKPYFLTKKKSPNSKSVANFGFLLATDHVYFCINIITRVLSKKLLFSQDQYSPAPIGSFVITLCGVMAAPDL